MPVQSSVVDDKRLTLAWERWLKTVSDFAVDAGRVPVNGGLSYVLVGTLVHAEYNGVGGVSVTLPSAPVGVLWVDALVGTTWTKIQAIDGQIKLPTAATVHFSTTYITNVKN